MTLNVGILPILLTAIFFIWLVVLTFFLRRVLDSYNRLTKGADKKDLMSVLDKLLKEFGQQGKIVDGLVKEIGKIKKDNVTNIQKIGLVRFNPFAGTGGDQSFCLAVLDGEDSGLVISSLHSRDTTRIYAKPVKKGKTAGYELSAEEIQAIKNAK